jgi:hypothetical protein
MLTNEIRYISKDEYVAKITSGTYRDNIRLYEPEKGDEDKYLFRAFFNQEPWVEYRVYGGQSVEGVREDSSKVFLVD